MQRPARALARVGFFLYLSSHTNLASLPVTLWTSGLRDGVFTQDLIDQRVRLKEQEIKCIGTMPHPFEHTMSFNR